MKFGEIWLVNFPFSDGITTKLRLVLSVSPDKFNVGGDVVVVPISSLRSVFSEPYRAMPSVREGR